MKIECETVFMLISNLITKVSPSFWSTISVTMNCTLREKCPNSDQNKNPYLGSFHAVENAEK